MACKHKHTTAYMLVIIANTVAYMLFYKQCMVAYMQGTQKVGSCKCGSIYALNGQQRASKYICNTVDPANLAYMLVFNHYVVAYMQVVGKAWPCICCSIYACRNSSQNVQCTHVYEYPPPVHHSIYGTQSTLRT